MSVTFEELASDEIDRLFSSALFLTGGRSRAAEDLILWTLTKAFHDFQRSGPGSDPTRWLDGRLVLEFLDAARRLESESPDPVDPLYTAAGSIPPRARSALFLVLLRRWPYADVAALLGGSRSEVSTLLEYRIALSALIRPDRAPASDIGS